jgi:hypothetical protein
MDNLDPHLHTSRCARNLANDGERVVSRIDAARQHRYCCAISARGQCDPLALGPGRAYRRLVHQVTWRVGVTTGPDESLTVAEARTTPRRMEWHSSP